MPINPYDEALSDLGPKPDNPYVDLLNAQERSGEQRVRKAVVEAQGTTPDRTAEAIRVGRTLGLPTAVVERNFDEMKRRASLEATPIEDIQAATPALADWLSAKPEHAKVAADDLEGLGSLEWLLTAPQRAFARGQNALRFSELRTKSIFQPLTQEERDQLNAYRFHMQQGGELGSGDSTFRKAVAGASEQLPNLFGGALSAAKYGLPGLVAGAGVGAAAGVAGMGPGAAAGATVGGGWGLTAGSRLGAFRFGFELEAGHAYDEYLEAGIDEDAAKGAAIAVGAINGGLEALGLEVLLKSIPGAKALGSAGVRAAVKEALKKPTIRAALGEAVKTYAGTLSLETMTEVAQRAVTIVGGELAKAGTDPGLERKSAPQILDELVEEGTTAFQSFLLLSAGGPTLSVAHEAGKAKRAKQTEQYFQALGTAVTGSKAVERAPEAVREFLERATKDGPIETVYAPVDTWVQYWQSEGVDPGEIAAQVTGRPEALEEALRTGADLEIPTARYAVSLAGTKHNGFLAREIRLAPDEWNLRESEAWAAEQERAKAAESAAPVLPEAVPSALESLKATIAGQLEERGGLERQTAQTYAELYGAAGGALAEAAGVDPGDVFGPYRFGVSREGTTPAPEQKAAAGPVAKRAKTFADAADFKAHIAKLSAERQEWTGAVSEAFKAQGIVRARNRQDPTLEHVIHESTRKPGTLQVTSMRAGVPEGHLEVGTIEQAAREIIGDEIVDFQGGEVQSRGTDAARSEGTEATAGTSAGPDVLDAGTEQRRVDPSGDAEGGGDGGRVERRRLPAPDYGEVFARKTEEEDRARITPEVHRELERIADELSTFGFTPRTWTWLEGPKTGSAAGGAAEIVAGSAGAEVYHDIIAYAPVGIVKSGKRKGEAAREASGTRQQVLDAVRAVLRSDRMTTGLAEGAVRVAERRAIDDYSVISRPELPPSWGEPVSEAFTDALSAAIDNELTPVSFTDDATFEPELLEAEGDVDTSFNPRELEQSLFEDLRPDDGTDRLTSTREDVLDTGETQPRLPGAEDVRDREERTPEFEAPFSLTAEAAKPRGRQRELFQPERFGLQALGSGDGGHSYGWGAYFPTEAAVEQAYAAAGLERPDVSAFLEWETSGSRYREIEIEATKDAGAVDPETGRSWTNAARAAMIGRRMVEQGVRGVRSEVGFVVFDDRITQSRQPFQSRPGGLTTDSVRAWADGVQQKYGPDLAALELYVSQQGDLVLDILAVARGAARAGLGARVMEELTRFADANGARIILSVAPRGYQPIEGGERTTSPGRLKAFYKRFGFVENKGRHKDFTIRESMYRRPTEPVRREFGQATEPATIEELRRRGFDTSRTFFHQTAAVNVPAITSEGFDLAKGRARLTDEQVPDGVFFKPTEADIAVGAEGAEAAQIPVFLRFGETRTFADRRGLENYIASRDATYDRLAREARAYDSDQAKVFDAKWNELRALDRGMDEYAQRKADLEIDQMLEDWKAGNVDRASSARRRATEVLRAEGVETVVISNDVGSMGRKTETIIAIAGQQVALAEPGNERILFQPEEERSKRRGAIRFGPSRQVDIALFEKADLSTFLHETGHFFLEVMGDLVDRVSAVDPASLTEKQRKLLVDYATILQWVGVEGRDQITDAHHEQFARGFEAYLMEGNAPSIGLQAAFSRFRSWLIGVYRQLRNLNVELTPDVRKVFDRMLATERQMFEVEQREKVRPMFLTPEIAGMEAGEFAMYRGTVEAASTRARELFERRLMSEVQREQEDAYKARRAEVEAEVAADVYERPVYRALAAMQKGRHPDGRPLVDGDADPKPLKVSRESIVRRFSEARLKRLPRPYIYTTKDGIEAEAAAELFGFASSDEMLDALETAEPMADAIRRETESRMLAEAGSILLDGTIHERAMEAVANEERDAVIRHELRALARLRRTVKPFVQAAQDEAQAVESERAYERRWLEAEARLAVAEAEQAGQEQVDALRLEVRRLRDRSRGGPAAIAAAIPNAAVYRDAARDTIGRLRIRDVKPMVYWAASRRAAEAAVAAAARQDFDSAIAFKQAELLNIHLFREAGRVRDEVQSRVKHVRELSRGKARQRLGQAGQSYLDQVDGMLDRYEFANVPQKVLDRRASVVKWAEGLESQGLPVDLPAEVLDEARRTNYLSLSVDEFMGVTDGLKAIEHLARLKNRLLKAKDKREFSAIRDAIVAEILSHGKARPAKLEFRAKDERARSVGDWFASHTKIAILAESLDGYVSDGKVWNAIIRPLNEAAADESNLKLKAGREYRAIIGKHYSSREVAGWSRTQHIPAIGASLSKEGILAVALNWGNETSRSRLLNDPKRRWSRQQIDAILGTLDRRDWEFVQATWNFIDQFWPEIAAKQERVTGVAPEKVEPAEVRTIHGVFKGGYYPLKYDARLNMRSGQFETLEEAKRLTQAAYVSQTTRRGHVEARKRDVRLSIQLEIGVVFDHLEQVIHDLTHHEVLLDVTRVLRDPAIAEAMMSRVGDIGYRQFTSAIEDIAAGGRSTRRGDGMMGRALNHAIRGTQIAALGLNLWTAAQQPLGLFNGAAEVGPLWVARGMRRWLRDAASLENTVRWIREVSPMMRSRAATANQDLNDLRSDLRRAGGWFDQLVQRATGDRLTQTALLDGFLWHIGKMQQVADVPVWLGAYEKHMAGGKDEATAIALADQAVLDSQGGGQVKDLAAVQRGGPLARAFMLFYSYGNTVFNASRKSIGRTDFASPSAVLAFLGDMLMIYTLPAMGTVALAGLVGKRDPDDEDSWFEAVAREHLATAMNTMVFVRELSGLVRQTSRAYSGPVGTRVFELLTRAGQAIKRDWEDEEVDVGRYMRMANEIGGVFFHYPAGQAQRTVDGWVALEEGRTSNPLALLFGAPRK